MPILVATDREVVVIDVDRSTSVSAHGIINRPTCLASDPLVHGRAWCGTHRDGVFRTDDSGRSWRSVGLTDRLIMANREPRRAGCRLGGHRTGRSLALRGRWDYVGADEPIGDIGLVVNVVFSAETGLDRVPSART